MNANVFWGGAAISIVLVSWGFYLLARIFNLDVAGNFWDGNLWVYLTGSRWAMPASMTVGYTVVVFGVMLLIAGWRQVYRANTKGRIATGGPYALMRHPQYTGIF